MSVWEQRRKEREAAKPYIQPYKVTKFQAPKQLPAQPKAAGVAYVYPQRYAQVNVVKSSVIKNLTYYKYLEEEYGGPVMLPAPELMDFDYFHREGGMAAVRYREYEQQRSPMRYIEQPQTFSYYSRVDAEMAKYQRSAKEFEIGYPRYAAPQYDREPYIQQRTQAQPASAPLGRSKKPSEMTEDEYQEYERQRQQKSMLLLIRKVLYDKSVSTFDYYECYELLKMDKAFAAMYEEENMKKRLAENEAQRRADELRGQQESYSYAAQSAAQPQPQQQSYYRPAQPNQNQTNYARAGAIQGVSQNDLYDEISRLTRDNKQLQEKLQAAEFYLGDYEKQISNLQNQITDERQQRIQANKNFELAQRDMSLLKDEMVALKQRYEELKSMQEQQDKLEAAVKLSEQTYKPSSPGKPSMVDQLMMNCNQVLEKYANLEDTMRQSIAGQQSMYRNNIGTIKVDDESPIRGLGVKQYAVKDSLRAMESQAYVPSCLTDELDADNQITSMLPKSRFGSRPASQQ